MLATLRDLYEGHSPRALRFRTGLFLFDLATLAFIVATSFGARGRAVEVADALIGLAIAAELVARVAASRSRRREVLQFATLTDLVAILSFLAPIAGEGGGFLRALRTLRLLRVYLDASRLRREARRREVGPGAPRGPGRNEEAVVAVANLLVFVFVMTGIVYETQHRLNPEIGNYADALYFTVTALTTTGFGDITLPGTSGRMITVLIMIFGVTLFLRLAQVMFRPYKVTFPCPACGLMRHDPDAVHCKACGTVLNIPDEGAV